MGDNDYESLPEEVPVMAHMVAGATAGVMEHAAMYPIDCIKTRLQSVRCVPYSGLTDAFVTIVQKEGMHRVFRGMSAMVIGAGPAHAMYFACYENLKYHFTMKINGQFQNSSLANGMAGATATFFHDIIMNPADVIKQRMQMYGSTHATCRKCLTQTYRAEGALAFYRSFPTQFLMNVPFQTIHFVVYEKTQEWLNPRRQYNPASHVLSGASAGGVAAFLTNPLDVCKTLLNTQQHAGTTTVRGLADAARTVYAANGARTFFRGVVARCLYQMPSTAISWSVYEFAKYVFARWHRGDGGGGGPRPVLIETGTDGKCPAAAARGHDAGSCVRPTGHPPTSAVQHRHINPVLVSGAVSASSEWQRMD